MLAACAAYSASATLYDRLAEEINAAGGASPPKAAQALRTFGAPTTGSALEYEVERVHGAAEGENRRAAKRRFLAAAARSCADKWDPHCPSTGKTYSQWVLAVAGRLRRGAAPAKAAAKAAAAQEKKEVDVAIRTAAILKKREKVAKLMAKMGEAQFNAMKKANIAASLETKAATASLAQEEAYAEWTQTADYRRTYGGGLRDGSVAHFLSPPPRASHAGPVQVTVDNAGLCEFLMGLQSCPLARGKIAVSVQMHFAPANVPCAKVRLLASGLLPLGGAIDHISTGATFEVVGVTREPSGEFYLTTTQTEYVRLAYPPEFKRFEGRNRQPATEARVVRSGGPATSVTLTAENGRRAVVTPRPGGRRMTAEEVARALLLTETGAARLERLRAEKAANDAANARRGRGVAAKVAAAKEAEARAAAARAEAAAAKAAAGHRGTKMSAAEKVTAKAELLKLVAGGVITAAEYTAQITQMG